MYIFYSALFIGILWGFRGCDTKCVSGKNFAKTLGVKRRQSFRGGGKFVAAKQTGKNFHLASVPLYI